MPLSPLELSELAKTSPFYAMRIMGEQEAARRAAGGQLYQMYGQGQPQPGMAPPAAQTGGGGLPPPPPGTPQGGPQAPPPGMNFAPPAQPGMPRPPMAAGPAPGPAAPPTTPPAPPAQIQPFRPLPTGGATAGGPQGVPPPPSAPALPGAQPDVQPPGQQFNLPTLIKQLKSSGIPSDKVMDMLDQLSPVMNSQNKQELEVYKLENQAMRAGLEAYARIMQAEAATKRADTGVKAEERRADQGQQKIDLMKRRTAQMAGGSGNLKKVELIYPKDASGKVDQTKEPIGTRAITKSGKMIYLDADGIQTTAGALAGGTASEDKASRVGVTNVVRQNIVRAGVRNSLARLDEVVKKFPNLNTSMFFGAHDEGPVTRGLYGAGRSQMSSEQKQADAGWASVVDEAIPVFTGGLRGSDAFRRFLIGQVPGPGDDAGSRTEKVRLLRANIQGTSHAFFDRFAADPSMWASGITPEEVDEAKTSIEAPGAAPKPKPAAPATAGGWKVEKVAP